MFKAVASEKARLNGHQNLPIIPWALPKEETLSESVTSLWRDMGVKAAPPKIDFIDIKPVIPTRINLGKAAAVSMAAFGGLISRIAQNRGMRPGGVTVNVRQSELYLMGVFAAKVNGRNFIRASLSRAAMRQNASLGILKSLPFFQIARCADGNWFHTHGNFDCSNIQRVFDGAARKKPIKEQIGLFKAIDLEQQLAKRNAIGAMFRSPADWALHPQGASLLDRPCVEIEKIGPGLPIPMQSSDQPPLAGLRVLDLTRVLAGPACARLLCAYGAECLKVTAPHLPFYPFFSQVENQGKRSTSLDLRQSQGRQDLEALAADADVFINSYRPGALKKFGFNPDRAARLNSRGMIYVSISCYGPGPWEDRGGYDSLAQVVSGLALAHSGLSSTREFMPNLLPMTAPNDYICALLAASGILAALMRRQEEGGSYHVKVSLTQAAMWILKFGYRSTPTRSLLQHMISPNLFDYYTYWQARRNRQANHSDFGEIQSLKLPLNFQHPLINEQYRYPSSVFGKHPAVWCSRIDNIDLLEDLHLQNA